MTNALDREHILLYEADVTPELLNGLRNPNDAATAMKWPTIWRKKLPYKPYDTFAGRFVAELVTPSFLPSRSPSDPPNNVNGAIKHGKKRPYEQEDSGSTPR